MRKKHNRNEAQGERVLGVDEIHAGIGTNEYFLYIKSSIRCVTKIGYPRIFGSIDLRF